MAAMAGSGWQGAQEEAKQSPSVGRSLPRRHWGRRWSVAAAAVCAMCAMCVCGVRSGRDNSESLSGCANRDGLRGRGGDRVRGSSSPAWHSLHNKGMCRDMPLLLINSQQMLYIQSRGQKWANIMNNLVFFKPRTDESQRELSLKICMPSKAETNAWIHRKHVSIPPIPDAATAPRSAKKTGPWFC